MWWLYKFYSENIELYPFFKIIGGFSATIKYFCSPADIVRIVRNIKLVKGKDFSVWKAFLIGHRVLVNFVYYWLDFIYFGKKGKDFILENIVVSGKEYLDEALSKGQGLVLATAHLGNWEVAGFWLGAMGYPTSAIALPHKDKRIDEFFNQMRINNGLISVIPVGRTTKCIRVLKNKHILAILGDWDFSGGNVVIDVDFFSKRICLPSGLSVFSKRFSAPVVPLFCVRHSNRYYIKVFPPIYPQGKTEHQIMQYYADCLQEMLSSYYLQWYMFGPIKILPEPIESNQLCIVIPAYNEERHIGGLLERLSSYGYKVIVVDDGSTDRTSQISARYDFVQVHRLSCNEGKGVAIKEGIALAKSYGYKWILLMDADGQHLPEDIPNFLNAMSCGVGMVCGNRMHNPKGMPLIRRFTNWLMSFIISLYTLDWIPDTQCGYRLIRSEAILPERLIGDRYEIETDLILRVREMGWDIVSVPVTSVYHNSAVSYINPFRDTMRFVWFMLSDIIKRVRRDK